MWNLYFSEKRISAYYLSKNLINLNYVLTLKLKFTFISVNYISFMFF